MRRGSWVILVVAGLVLLGLARVLCAAAPSTSPASHPTTVTSYGKDVVVLDQLVAMYEPVPFSHKMHAQMADMWNGCETCHHHTPAATTQPASARPAIPSKNDAAMFPACKSCHPVAADNIAIQMPSLKGAYHRQCLNCHREWMDSNACIVCHAVRPGSDVSATTRPVPLPDDITGRMHKPIPAPAERKLVARFTPVAGPNVLFRHEEHTKQFGVRCVTCHHDDSCITCHSPSSTTAPATATATAPATQAGAGSHPLKPGRTWRETHAACANCHQDDRCTHCHYQTTQNPPPAFDHQVIAQRLDKDHLKLACTQCHVQYRPSVLTCGDKSCHKNAVTYPADRPGRFVPPTSPAKSPTTKATTSPATQPATRPIMTKIRRGGTW